MEFARLKQVIWESGGPLETPATTDGMSLWWREMWLEVPSMPTIRHVEKYFTGCETVRDVVIGMADGLTIPFALAAGLSAAVTSTKIIPLRVWRMQGLSRWGLAATSPQRPIRSTKICGASRAMHPSP